MKAPLPTREQVLATGTKIEFIVCPLCSKNRKLTRYKGEQVRFDSYDFDRPIIQIRYGGGRGSGFWMNEAESLTIQQIIDDPTYEDILNQIREQCTLILERTRKG